MTRIIGINNFNNIIFNNFRANQLPGAARVISDNQNAAGGMFGFVASMEANAGAQSAGSSSESKSKTNWSKMQSGINISAPPQVNTAPRGRKTVGKQPIAPQVNDPINGRYWQAHPQEPPEVYTNVLPPSVGESTAGIHPLGYDKVQTVFC